MARRKYGSFTPARRAALRKAQLASARKRRGRRRAVGIGVGVVAVAGVGAGAYLGHRYVRGLKGGPKPPQAVPHASPRNLPDIRRVGPARSGQNWPIVGKPLTATAAPKKKRKRPTYVEWEKNRVKKALQREKKLSKMRRKYWQGKPVGGSKVKI